MRCEKRSSALTNDPAVVQGALIQFWLVHIGRGFLMLKSHHEEITNESSRSKLSKSNLSCKPQSKRMLNNVRVSLILMTSSWNKVESSTLQKQISSLAWWSFQFNKAAERKRRPFELLREAVWPLRTSLKVVGLLSSTSGSKRKRAPFHQ